MKKTFALILLLSFLFSIPYDITNASAQSAANSETILNWSLEEITDGSIPDEIVKDKRAFAKNGLPDGRVATGTGDIAKAWYSESTTRYRHGVLGDAIEAGALKVVNARGETFTFRLPRTEVFEDITPRLADLDGDGRTEVITILSSSTQGASVAVFHLNGNAFIKAGQTKFIGRSNRWLNISGIDNIAGDRRPEIAIVVTPHLAGILQFYQFQNGKLQLIAQLDGYTNHVIGSGELRLSKMLDVDGNRRADLIIPSLDRAELVILGVVGNKLREISRIALPARLDKAIGTRAVNGKTEIVVGLEDDKIYSISLQ